MESIMKKELALSRPQMDTEKMYMSCYLISFTPLKNTVSALLIENSIATIDMKK